MVSNMQEITSKLRKSYETLLAKQYDFVVAKDSECARIWASEEGEEYYTNYALNELSMVLQANAEGIRTINTTFYNVLSNNEYAEYIEKVPFMLPVEDDFNAVMVFPNIILRDVMLANPERAATITTVYDMYTLEPQLKALKDHISKTKKASGKALSDEEQIKWLLRNSRTTIDRVLTRNLGMTDKLNASKIRDLATSICNNLKPIKMCYAETESEYVSVFENGYNTCMTGKNREWTPAMKACNYSPALFYYYNPYSSIAYIERDGKVAARAVVFKTSHTLTHYDGYTKAYAFNTEMKYELICRMKADGITQKNFILPKMYRFKPKFYDGDYICPTTYIDNCGSSIYYGFDIKTREFVIGPDKGEVYRNTEGVVGTKEAAVHTILHAKNLLSKKTCCICSRELINPIYIQGRGFFGEPGVDCSCLYKNGYVKAIQANGDSVWVPGSSAFNATVLRGSRVFYTTEYACEKLNPLPAVVSLGFDEVTTMFPVHTGDYYKIKFKGAEYMLPPDLYVCIKKGTMKGWNFSGDKLVFKEYDRSAETKGVDW